MVDAGTDNKLPRSINIAVGDQPRMLSVALDSIYPKMIDQGLTSIAPLQITVGLESI